MARLCYTHRLALASGHTPELWRHWMGRPQLIREALKDSVRVRMATESHGVVAVLRTDGARIPRSSRCRRCRGLGGLPGGEILPSGHFERFDPCPHCGGSGRRASAP